MNQSKNYRPARSPLPEPFDRPQKKAVVYGMICFILVLLICQLWLITATVNAVLGGDESVIWPSAIASLCCLLLNIGLLRYLYKLEDPV